MNILPPIHINSMVREQALRKNDFEEEKESAVDEYLAGGGQGITVYEYLDKIAKRGEKVTFAEFHALQSRAMTSPDNMKRAERHYGRKVTPDEAATYFVVISGQAKKFQNEYGYLVKK
jgi:hypothetical protein